MKLICSFHSGSVVLVSTDVSPWEGEGVKATQSQLVPRERDTSELVPPADSAGQALGGAVSLLLSPFLQFLSVSLVGGCPKALA